MSVCLCVYVSCDHAAHGTKGQPGPPGPQVNKSLFNYIITICVSFMSEKAFVLSVLKKNKELNKSVKISVFPVG